MLVIRVSILFIISPVILQAQMVEGIAYNIMLKALLSHGVTEVSARQAYEDTSLVFVDARAINEYRASHIRGAVWCGYDDFDLSRLSHVPKDRKIVVYCSVGYRSEKISEKLVKAGYTDVANMYGGIFEWKNRNYPLVDDAGNATEKIHAYDRIWGVWLDKGEKVYD